ncbi:MAG: hypothetical protein HQL97_00385 [Magnetococcales bacterium]|nr:hypothetical protein [Magnetococcales bacterium]
MMLLQLVLEILQRHPPDPQQSQKDRDAQIGLSMAGSDEDVALELHRVRDRLRHEGAAK